LGEERARSIEFRLFFARLAEKGGDDKGGGGSARFRDTIKVP
jgi:hypothetical protein